MSEKVKLLFETIKTEAKLKNDASLAKYLGVSSGKLSDLKSGRVTLGPAIIVKIMNAHPISLLRIQQLLEGEKK